MEDELQTYLATDPTPEEIDAWFDTKRNINDVLVSQLQAVEDFCEKRRVAKLDVTQQSKRTRREFYQEKAASLNPPIELKVLHNCASYQKAIAISRPPVDLERSWRTLLPKLKAEEGPVKAHIERQDRETQRLRDLHAGTRPHYKGLIGQGLPNYYG